MDLNAAAAKLARVLNIYGSARPGTQRAALLQGLLWDAGVDPGQTAMQEAQCAACLAPALQTCARSLSSRTPTGSAAGMQHHNRFAQQHMLLLGFSLELIAGVEWRGAHDSWLLLCLLGVGFAGLGQVLSRWRPAGCTSLGLAFAAGACSCSCPTLGCRSIPPEACQLRHGSVANGVPQAGDGAGEVQIPPGQLRDDPVPHKQGHNDGAPFGRADGAQHVDRDVVQQRALEG